MDDMRVAETSGRGEHLLNRKVKLIPQAEQEVFQLSGNSYSILKYRDEQLERRQYKYVKISVIGSQMNNFGYGCFYLLITMVVIFFFPIFCFCIDSCKRRICRLYNIDFEVYQVIGTIIGDLSPQEVYLVLQDNNFNEQKCSAISRGLERSHTHKFQFVNTSEGLNTYGHNYSDFHLYARQWKQFVPQTRIRWSRKAI